MKVKDLIKQLQAIEDQELEVIASWNESDSSWYTYYEFKVELIHKTSRDKLGDCIMLH